MNDLVAERLRELFPAIAWVARIRGP